MTPEFSLNLEQLKTGFFDLIDGAERMARKNSEILAAQVRKAAMNSMKYKAKLPKKKQALISARTDGNSSLPGDPPLVHLGLLKKHIFYAWDKQKDHAVIGPTKLPRLGEAPHSLEFGMTTLIRSVDKNGNPVILRVHLEPRPYMVPALRRVMEPGNVERAYKKSLGKFVKSVKKKYT